MSDQIKSGSIQTGGSRDQVQEGKGKYFHFVDERQDPFQTSSSLPVKAEPLGFLDREDLVRGSSTHRSGEVALEIAISWGATVLQVLHLSPPRNFVVGEVGTFGEVEPGGGAVDFLLPEEALGRKSLPLVCVDDGGLIQICVPDIALGSVKEGKKSRDLQELRMTAAACPTATRAQQIPLEVGARMRLQIMDLEFHLSLVKRVAPLKRGFASGWDTTVPSYFLGTLLMAGSFFASLAYFVPPLGLSDDEGLAKERFLLISQYLDAASEREVQIEESPRDHSQSAEESGATGERAQGEQGEAGKRDAIRTNKRVSVKGPRDNTQLSLSRHEAVRMAKEFGMIGLLNSAQSSDPDTPTSVFGGDFSLGSDDLSANGNFFGDEPGESGGFGGLSMSGDGFGGGDLLGVGVGIGVGRVGTIRPGQGKAGWGRGQALTSKGHKVASPTLRIGKTKVNGRLPPQVIQRVVRQNFGRFRMCYMQALGRNPNLEGRIPVRFVIGRDGAVSNVAAGGDLPDASVRSCVQSAFYGISFPPPEGGVVTVTYPLLFSPD